MQAGWLAWWILSKKRGLVERKSATDRRENALHITTAGRQFLQQLGSIARAQDDATCEGLPAEERGQLRTLLERIAQRQGLAVGVHPSYRILRPRRGLQRSSDAHHLHHAEPTAPVFTERKAHRIT
jgi:hypothetical protein